MRLTPRLRRVVITASIATAAILLPAVALASSAGTTTAANTAAVHRCYQSELRAWLAIPGSGAAGSVYYELELSNVSAQTCTLYGYPGVSAVDRNGHLVGVPATHGGTKQLITLRPGATAHVLLAVTDPGAVCAHPVSASQLRVYAPGQFVSHLVPFSVQVCPSTATLHVDAVHPSAGIPFYSNK